MTAAPCSEAYLIPFPTEITEPLPWALRTLTGSIFILRFGVQAVTIPETCVPCPFKSVGVVSLSTRSYPPLVMRPDKNGWDETPLSTMATFISFWFPDKYLAYLSAPIWEAPQEIALSATT